MVTLEQVKLLESKVGKALGYIDSLSAENATLREKLDGYRRRIDELETIVLAFKEDQGRIEAGIISALERLNQFEDAVERGINDVRASAVQAQPEAAADEAQPTAPVSDEESEPELRSSSDAQEEPIAASDDQEADSENIDAEDKTGELDIF